MANFLKEYTLLGELGKGGFATVYKVRHNELGYIRAVRVLNDPVIDEKCKAYRNFLRECKVLLRLGNGNHRNIVHIYQPRFLENHALVEMDFVDGTDIAHYLKKNDNFLPIDEVIRMVKEISSALAYCHEDIYKFCMNRDDDDLKDDPKDGSKVLVDEATRKRLIEKYKVIHNDIHSGNIMRREDGSFTLLDFGLAIEGDEVVKSSSRHENGAPEFMPPEKFDNELILTEQSDIYSFGVVMFEYLAGRVPFVCDGKSFSAIKNLYDVVKSHDIPAIIDLRRQNFENKFSGQKYKKDYPDWLETAILKCLEKDPAKRFRNGKELYSFILEKDDCQTNTPNDSSIIVEMKNLYEETQLIKDVVNKIYNEISVFVTKDNDTTKRLAEVENSIKQLINKKPELPIIDSPAAKRVIPVETKNTIVKPTIIKKGKDETIFVNGLPMDMVYVEGGAFMMGANDDDTHTGVFEDEKPAHNVVLEDFYIGKFEVTQELWKTIMDTNPSRFKGNDFPVEFLSWNDCQSFIEKLNALTGKEFALPTESQWEYAARGGVLSKGYKYSGSDNINEVAWHTDNSKNRTHRVGELNPNELGIYDMSGNIWEWCLDAYKDYKNYSNKLDEFDVNSVCYRVLRGGCWSNDYRYCRVLCRNSQYQSYPKDSFGFRLAMKAQMNTPSNTTGFTRLTL